MRNLPLTTALRIYREDYWDRIKADQLPDHLRFHVFDAAVNSGPGQAVKWLQRAAGVAQDGVIGPKTMSAATMVTVAQYSAIRLRFMTDLPTWTSFGKGWARRIADNLEITE
jgi:lysozyme family protein